jgi:acyl-[acyl-carrier-protein]-phospholipid O-acyltransferase/long-chain-fatty-acid--[acyl-carrier-protein] ligase
MGGRASSEAPRYFRELSPMPADWTSLSAAFVGQARSHPSNVAVADSNGTSLTYGDTLLRSAVLGHALSQIWGPAKHVGIMVPPTVPGVVANLAANLMGKIAVNLNYTANQAMIDSSIKQCGITHVITSRKVVERFKIVPGAEIIYLEDLPAKITWKDKLWGALVAKAVPKRLLKWFLPGVGISDLEETATVIFTSGSTGEPKGVVLSQRNILQNAWQVEEQVHLKPNEVLLGVLPFFHAFGFTVTIWTALGLGKKVVYHINPLDARTVGKLCEEHKVTLLVATPSFTRFYLKSCGPEQFSAVTHLILGAEKLKPELARDIKSTLNIEPLEGYGCTELSPVVAVNLPDKVTMPDGRVLDGNRPGTVGLPVPGTLVKTIDPDTGADLPEGAEGMIAVKGPQVMMGYLHNPRATERVVKDGWYSTGDLGYLDADGFLKITDRLSRFSKIAGEMVPHLNLESMIMEITGVDEHHLAVTGVPDAKSGERLCVLYTDLGMPVAEIFQQLNQGSLPKLWIPAARDFIQVEEIPITATGKVDLKRLRDVALKQSGAQPAGQTP